MCRSALTPDRWSSKLGNISNAKNFDKHVGHVYSGRFNTGVVTLNLPDVAFTAKHENRDFFDVLDERCELCHKGIKTRIDRLENVKSDVAPILWQDGAFARLNSGESISKLLHGGYSTASLGFVGLWETVLGYTGNKLTTPDGKEFGLKVLKFLNDKCAEWKKAEDVDYSLYGTPEESTTFKFSKALKSRYPEDWKKLGNKNYVTNSYHIHVTEPIDAFDKLAFESCFQKLSPGGAISYIECPDLTKNTEVVLEVMKFIYNNIMYAELNTKSDYCQNCGYDGEIQIIEEDGNYIWECPNCHCRDKSKLNVARRTCGYIGSNFWNYGRTEEIKERVLHLDNE